MLCFSSNTEAILQEIISREPLVTPARSDQVRKLIESMPPCVMHYNDYNVLLELQQKLGQSEAKHFYLFKVLRAHILPLTNVAFNKSGSRYEYPLL